MIVNSQLERVNNAQCLRIANKKYELAISFWFVSELLMAMYTSKLHTPTDFTEILIHFFKRRSVVMVVILRRYQGCNRYGARVQVGSHPTGTRRAPVPLTLGAMYSFYNTADAKS